mmetsp:Transcript_16546/g.21895  ORF Transcript_16546/g.21895 Transcript_16546/m.21895 type:complete len:128 (-) Transcript_16546:159-542(-)
MPESLILIAFSFSGIFGSDATSLMGAVEDAATALKVTSELLTSLTASGLSINFDSRGACLMGGTASSAGFVCMGVAVDLDNSSSSFTGGKEGNINLETLDSEERGVANPEANWAGSDSLEQNPELPG